MQVPCPLTDYLILAAVISSEASLPVIINQLSIGTTILKPAVTSTKDAETRLCQDISLICLFSLTSPFINQILKLN